MTFLIIVLILLVLLFALDLHIDITSKGQVLLWYGRKKRNYIKLFKIK